MSAGRGLSEAAAKRLEVLEARESLEPYNRGELRAMAFSHPSADESARIEKLLSPGSSGGPEGSGAYERGLRLGRESYHRG